MTIARSQCVHTLMLHVNHNIQVYALPMYTSNSNACNIYTNIMMHLMQQRHIYSHCIYMCEECMYCILCNLYSNTAPSLCINFMYAIYALCASYAAALYASKYLYVRPHINDPFRSTLSSLHFIVSMYNVYIVYTHCALCMYVQCACL